MSTNNEITKEYASIEKPWLKYYDGTYDEKDIPNMSIFQLVKKNIDTSPEKVILDMRVSKNDFRSGIKITNKQLLNLIEKGAKASQYIGIKENEIVPIILPNVPEARVMIYSNSSIGATSYPMSPFIAPNQLEAIIKENGIRNLVIFSAFYDRYRKILEQGQLENIIITNGKESLPPLLRSLSPQKKLTSSYDRIVTWDEYMRESRKCKKTVEPAYKEDHVAAIIGTSGTTGVPKGVKVTDKNLNTVATTYINTGVLEGKFCDALIPSISYGLSLLHYQTVSGTYTYLIPELVTDKISKLLVRLKPDTFAGGPIHAINVLRSKEFSNGTIMPIKDFISGGASLPKDIESGLNHVDKGYSEEGVYNPSIFVRQGYALTETTAQACYNKKGAYKFGSIGIPFPYENVGIFQPNTDIELPYETPGEICISGPSVMAGYLNNEEETKEVIKVHRDGTKWVHTKDIGYMEKDGHLFHIDRIKDIFMRSGFNVHPSKITEFLNCLEDVKESIVIGVEHPDEQCVPVAFIVPEQKDDKTLGEIEQDIKQECDNCLESCSVPYEYIFVDELPINLGGKIDKPKILQKAGLDFSSKNSHIEKQIKFKQE